MTNRPGSAPRKATNSKSGARRLCDQRVHRSEHQRHVTTERSPLGFALLSDQSVGSGSIRVRNSVCFLRFGLSEGPKRQAETWWRWDWAIQSSEANP